MPRGGIRKTHNEFINELNLKNPKLLENFTLIDKYYDVREKIKLKGKYGVVEMIPTTMLNGSLPTIQSAINKNEYFMNIANEVHCNKYSYDKLDYKNARNTIVVTCGKHGDFKVNAGEHLRGKKCYKCSKEENGNALRNDTEYFIENSSNVHNNKYDYSMSKYITNDTYIKIKCPIHGIFEQKSGNHMRGQGCPTCNSSYFNIESAIKHSRDYNKNMAKLYIIKMYDGIEEFYKIGITTKAIKNRFKNPKEYNYNKIVTIEDTLFRIIFLEDYLHQLLSNYSYEPYKRFRGYTECFDEVDINIIEFAYANLGNRIKNIKEVL